MFDVANKIKEYLIDYLKANKADMKVSEINEMEQDTQWRQVKDMFTTMAIFFDYEPDTYQGDSLLVSVYGAAELDDIVDQEDFDCYMWSDMC